ncbi:hypothetical protein I5E68_06940 [Novosphingobium sp. YJ-S2-02]|uniref:ASCH domain-containing protein n=1 Tax=Novosphingobium aureum TaxID=2792964 RepID=A0A931HB08_9SPHN|nr:hypothetical protein [Novosphingobium aureum]MBH0112685.1 hypothetical protein [Novosphingobium aureum]
MADKGIIFSAAMVRALLDGRKTQTRRLVKKPAALDALAVFKPAFLQLPGNADLLPYAPGDRLYVREAHAIDGARSWYRLGHEEALARGPRVDVRWRPSIHMPRWASRLWLEVAEVRVQRIADISEADALAEGIERVEYPEKGDWGWPQRRFAELWNSLHTTKGERWEDNPWIVAVSFNVHRGNIDEVAG